MKKRSKELLVWLSPVLLVSCATGSPQPWPPDGGDRITVIDQGWHTEIAVPVDGVSGGLRLFTRIYPGARVLVFGYGKRTFMTAPPDDLGEYLVGPFPGPAVIETIALSAPPARAYGSAEQVTLSLPPGGAARLSGFLWSAFTKSPSGDPILVGPGPFRGALFYAARHGYGLDHTCNTWVAEALQAAGLPIHTTPVIFASQLMRQIRKQGRRQH